MNNLEIAALFELADRAPKTTAERLWLEALKLAVQKQLEEQAAQTKAEQEKVI